MVTYTSQVHKQHLFPSAQNIEVNNHVVKANMSLSPQKTTTKVFKNRNPVYMSPIKLIFNDPHPEPNA